MPLWRCRSANGLPRGGDGESRQLIRGSPPLDHDGCGAGGREAAAPGSWTGWCERERGTGQPVPRAYWKHKQSSTDGKRSGARCRERVFYHSGSVAVPFLLQVSGKTWEFSSAVS